MYCLIRHTFINGELKNTSVSTAKKCKDLKRVMVDAYNALIASNKGLVTDSNFDEVSCFIKIESEVLHSTAVYEFIILASHDIDAQKKKVKHEYMKTI